MLTTLASTFMTATRMDAFAQAGAAAAPFRRARHRGWARALGALRRLAG